MLECVHELSQQVVKFSLFSKLGIDLLELCMSLTQVTFNHTRKMILLVSLKSLLQELIPIRFNLF